LEKVSPLHLHSVLPTDRNGALPSRRARSSPAAGPPELTHEADPKSEAVMLASPEDGRPTHFAMALVGANEVSFVDLGRDYSERVAYR